MLWFSRSFSEVLWVKQRSATSQTAEYNLSAWLWRTAGCPHGSPHVVNSRNNKSRNKRDSTPNFQHDHENEGSDNTAVRTVNPKVRRAGYLNPRPPGVRDEAILLGQWGLCRESALGVSDGVAGVLPTLTGIVGQHRLLTRQVDEHLRVDIRHAVAVVARVDHALTWLGRLLPVEDPPGSALHLGQPVVVMWPLAVRRPVDLLLAAVRGGVPGQAQAVAGVVVVAVSVGAAAAPTAADGALALAAEGRLAEGGEGEGAGQGDAVATQVLLTLPQAADFRVDLRNIAKRLCRC